jgi:hypothetical protein
MVLIHTNIASKGFYSAARAVTGPAGPLAKALLIKVIPIASRIPPKKPRIYKVSIKP